MDAIEIVCGCGRTMRPVWRRAKPSYVCGCGATIREAYPPVAADNYSRDRCQMWVGAARCGNPVIPGRPGTAPAAGRLCQNCAKELLDDALTFPATRDYLTEALGRNEIREARRRIALDEFKQRHNDKQRRRQEAKDAQAHVVYYVRLGENHIKIGTTGRLEERMAELRVANRANLLAAEPGNQDLEKQRHRQFTILRYDRRKEDFSESPRLLEHIATVRARWGDPWQLPASLVAVQPGSEVSSAQMGKVS